MPFAHYLLLGGPGETRQTVEETIETMNRTGATAVICALDVRIYPGTELHRAREYDLRGPLWSYLGQFRRRQRRMAGPRAGTWAAAPGADGGIVDRQGRAR